MLEKQMLIQPLCVHFLFSSIGMEANSLFFSYTSKIFLIANLSSFETDFLTSEIHRELQFFQVIHCHGYFANSNPNKEKQKLQLTNKSAILSHKLWDPIDIFYI